MATFFAKIYFSLLDPVAFSQKLLILVFSPSEKSHSSGELFYAGNPRMTLVNCIDRLDSMCDVVKVHKQSPLVSLNTNRC